MFAVNALENQVAAFLFEAKALWHFPAENMCKHIARGNDLAYLRILKVDGAVRVDVPGLNDDDFRFGWQQLLKEILSRIVRAPRPEGFGLVNKRTLFEIRHQANGTASLANGIVQICNCDGGSRASEWPEELGRGLIGRIGVVMVKLECICGPADLQSDYSDKTAAADGLQL